MLARFIIKKKIRVERILKLMSITGNISYWVIPVHVKANILWNLLVDEITDVEAFITFIHEKEHQRYQSDWIEPNVSDKAFINLHIGSHRNVGLVQESFPPNSLLVYNGELGLTSDEGIKLNGNYDILLELKSDDRCLGFWEFKRAIIGGVVQEISPVKLSASYNDSTLQNVYRAIVK